MNNLVQNYKIIYEQLVQNCSHIKSFPQIRQPKLSNLELVALNLTAEYISYSSELQLFRVIKRHGIRQQNRTNSIQQTTATTCRLHRRNS